MKELWSRWVAFTGRPVDARPLIWLRILMPLCVIGDFADMFLRGADRAILHTIDHGGMIPKNGDMYLFPGWDAAGPAVVAVTAAAMLMVSIGKFTRPALVVAILGYAQVGHLYPWGDRAIDHMIRTILIILLFSPVSAADVGRTVTGWTEDLIRWILVMMYMAAGINKITASVHWFVPGPSPALYRIMTSPIEAHLDPVFWSNVPWLFYLAGLFTLVLEMTAPVLLWRRWTPYWAVGGALMHLGIAFGMKLGMFSWGMLSFYPMLFAPWILPLLDRSEVAASD